MGSGAMDESVEAILNAAILAPSGDNTQPWRFVIDRAAGTIALELDEARDSSPMNSDQRMARIAVGAALENLLRRTASLGWAVELKGAEGRSLALVRLTGKDEDRRPNEVEDVIASRVTNRRA